MPTDDLHDLEVLLQSPAPLLAIETHEEPRVVELFQRLALRVRRPLFHWSVTEGLRRLEFEAGHQPDTADPPALLKHIKAASMGGVYLLADFHPYLGDPIHVRLLKEIALRHDAVDHTVALISHALEIPPELRSFTRRVELRLPNRAALEHIVQKEASDYARANGGKRVSTERKTLDALVSNLGGLTVSDAQRLARGAIVDDGAITENDLPKVMEAKHRLLNRSGALSFEYDTARLSEVGGLPNLKAWLQRRRIAFLEPGGLDTPRGILLVGVQGGGKSLAAKAVAGMWRLPLLRLDVGALYDKYYGESEKNLRQALQTAEVMAPCVLWIDEIEKAVAQGDGDDGVSQRMLGTLLTWMAEKGHPVFLVATANSIEQLPPELIRKGRLDEIFFVDLPDAAVRGEIFAIHLRRRDLDPLDFDLASLSAATAGFSGAEIEQAVVAALYLAREQNGAVGTDHILQEVRRTRPLAVVMAEQIETLRAWAQNRTVPA